MANMHNGNLGGVGNETLVTSVMVRQPSLVPRPSPAPVLQYAKAGAGKGLGTRLAIPARDPA